MQLKDRDGSCVEIGWGRCVVVMRLDILLGQVRSIISKDSSIKERDRETCS